MKINTKTVNSSEILVTALLRSRNRQTDRQKTETEVFRSPTKLNLKITLWEKEKTDQQ